LWLCKGCKRQFTVRIGTVFEDSRIPLMHWCYAFWAACSSKKGVSAKQIQRQTGLSYKSALFLMHRIRFAMADNYDGPLSGEVEVDETYVGGKPRYKTPDPSRPGLSKKGPTPNFKDRKTPVVALVERRGRVRARVVTGVTADNLKGAIRQYVDRSARIFTDERPAYKGIGDEYAGGHEWVTHPRGEYVRGDVHTNTVEGFFSLLKRGVYGTFHAVSKKHLHRYVSEFEFRYNTRHMDDGERVLEAIRGAEGKRLMYAVPVS
jgi:transposase-like protein